MKVLPYFHGHFGPLIKSIISSSIGDDIVPLVAVHATRALNNHPINSTIFFTCNLRFSNTENPENIDNAEVEVEQPGNNDEQTDELIARIEEQVKTYENEVDEVRDFMANLDDNNESRNEIKTKQESMERTGERPW